MSGNASSEDPESGAVGSPVFATTHWSVIVNAADASSPDPATALEKLCRSYWYPLYAYVRRLGRSPEDAQDLTQDFFERLLAKNDLQHVQPAKGRFRSFLLASIKHFVANQWDREQAARRGGGLRFVPLDPESMRASESLDTTLAATPDKLFDRRWALTLLDTVKRRLAAEFAGAGKAAMFDTLQIYLSGETGQTPYAEMAPRLSLSVDALKKAVERLRRRYGELLREEISQTVAHPSEIEDEIRHLRSVLAE
jgi:RNA polymerase sigma-70 factor (ECF subfamily)